MNYRRKANWVLGAVLILFGLAAWLKYIWPNHMGIHFFYFVSEASLVGGIADWFAVTALFRKPLGWPYHTALIPRNREKMIAGITSMVQNELLSEGLFRKKIESFQFASWWIRTADERGGARFLAEKLGELFGGVLGKVSVPHAAPRFERLIKDKLLNTGISKPLLQGIRSLLQEDEFDRWLEERIDEGMERASGSVVKARILKTLGQIQQEQVGNGGKLQKTLLGIFQVTDGLNLEEAADSLQVELILHLMEVKQQPNHPLRRRLKENLDELIEAWEKDPEILNPIEQWKNALIREMNFEGIIARVLETVLPALQAGKLPSGKSISDLLEPVFSQAWAEFKENPGLYQTLDRLTQDLLVQALRSEHAIIGQIVKETLEGFTDAELNRFIEDKAGEDLQWIRINGSIVGGLVGALLFILLNYGYTPLLNLL